MWITRGSHREQVQRRLAAAASGWVPTQALVREELAGPEPGEPVAVDGDGPVSWDAAAPAPPPRRIDQTVLPAVILVVVGALLGAAALWLLAWPRGVAVTDPAADPWPSSTVAAPGSSASPTPSASPAGVVVVDVAGAVRRPGVVELPAGSRVIDAVEAAGGVLHRADTTPLNLARVLADGEQVLVPARGGGGPVSVPSVPGATTAPAQVDLNTATFEQLEALPGIGPVLAQRILDWRAANGGFASIDQLQDVSGIGDATFADLAPLVRV